MKLKQINNNLKNKKTNKINLKSKKISFFVFLIFMIFFINISSLSYGSSLNLLQQTSAISINLVNQEPLPARSGELFEARIGIENQGGKESGVVYIEFIPSYPFTLKRGDNAVREIGILGSYQGLSNLRIERFNLLVDNNVKSGTYELKLKYYQKDSNFAITKTIPIEIKSKTSAEVIHIDKDTLLPGQQNEITFTINNVGNSPLRDLRFTWNNEEKVILPIGSDNSRYITFIDIGESKEIKYNVITDSNTIPGLYELDLNLDYYDDFTNEEKNINSIAGIYIGGETNFYISLNEHSVTQTIFNIANTGINPARSVSVQIPNQQNWIISGSNSKIVGNLNPGDYTVVSFNLENVQTDNNESNVITSSQTGSQGARRNIENTQTNNVDQENRIITSQRTTEGNNLRILIQYTDTQGLRKTIEKEINVISNDIISQTRTIPNSRTI
ncbi:MAG: COG1361 S-layer family protein, partial [Candidatus Woesearchaeota archaeon]